MDRRAFLKNLACLGVASAGAAVSSGRIPTTGEVTAAPLRPPGALPEDEFLTTCIRCMRCMDACPNQAIRPFETNAGADIAGTPFIKPREQACMLCSRVETDYLCCTKACPSGALQPILKSFESVADQVRMGVAEIDLNLCYSYNNYTCGTCYYACPMQAIRIGLWERPEIDAEKCIGCGLCERACIRYPQAVRVRPAERSKPRQLGHRQSPGRLGDAESATPWQRAAAEEVSP